MANVFDVAKYILNSVGGDISTVNYPPLIEVGACNCPVVQMPF